ncbi:MAG: hypothetical protein M1818_000285 [Claussenomyces sp. TS43310]|nr:MAG: hypothetical protein M1818_000285 [Claussenomyces sp. TS43310]
MPVASPSHPLIVIVGATGTGKSQLAVELATTYNGEIINSDAMQMYEDLPIITNKISIEEQRKIPHHLLGNVGLKEEPWRVGTFKREAERIIKDIHSRGRLPIVVGGTHYYTQSLFFDNAIIPTREEPEAQNDVPREEITKRFPILHRPTEEILAQLKTVDPIMADRWHPNDRRKIQRSLEVFLMTGTQASHVYEAQKSTMPIENDASQLLRSTLWFWVHAESEVLKARLDARVEKMMDSGLLDEVRSLGQSLRDQEVNDENLDKSRGIWVSIGFKEFESYLSALENSTSTNKELEKLRTESIEQMKAATRQYSRRQIRWIRIKLLAALSRAAALDRMFVLDGTDIKQWNERVLSPALRVAGDFLAGSDLPSPADLSPVANEVLAQKQVYDLSDRPDLWIRHTCELCNTTVVTEDQWQQHLKSRGHRRATKKMK